MAPWGSISCSPTLSVGLSNIYEVQVTLYLCRYCCASAYYYYHLKHSNIVVEQLLQ